jgi:hypothetical protein
MCIAQKTLKSMPSTTHETSQESDDLDDFAFTPKSGPISPISTPTYTDRPPSLISSTDESFTFEQQSQITMESNTNNNPNSTFSFISKEIIEKRNICFI